MRTIRRREPSPAVDVEQLSDAELLGIVNAAPSDPLSQSALEREAWRQISIRAVRRCEIDVARRTGSGFRT